MKWSKDHSRAQILPGCRPCHNVATCAAGAMQSVWPKWPHRQGIPRQREGQEDQEGQGGQHGPGQGGGGDGDRLRDGVDRVGYCGDTVVDNEGITKISESCNKY